MVYQGTVLGPQLWNLYFEDAANAIQEFLFEEVVLADDLNAYKILPSSGPHDVAMKAIDTVHIYKHIQRSPIPRQGLWINVYLLPSEIWNLSGVPFVTFSVLDGDDLCDE